MSDDMPEIDLEALDAYLMFDISPVGCMVLSDLDGFLTGIAVGLEPVPTSEWMSAIWGGDEPMFESEQQMRTVPTCVAGIYNLWKGRPSRQKPHPRRICHSRRDR